LGEMLKNLNTLGMLQKVMLNLLLPSLIRKLKQKHNDENLRFIHLKTLLLAFLLFAVLFRRKERRRKK